LDNVTHALAGLLAAEAVCVWRKESRPEVRASAYLVSALSNNLPDIDIVYTWITGPKPLGSLLHHRGHTHTLVIALLLAWLLALGAWRWFAKRHATASRRERGLIYGLALAGPLLHLSMDYGNNYGVHPFWPASGRWFYGDTIFIVEPTWWAIAIPVLAACARRRLLKVTLWLLLAAVLVVCWFVPFVLTESRLLLLVIAALAWAVASHTSERTRIVAALTACALVPLGFAIASSRAKANVGEATAAAFPALSVLDIAATPMPANPLCWEALVVGEQGGRYRVLRASVALPPLAAERCTAGADTEPTAQVTRITRADRDGVRWRTEYGAELRSLAELRAHSCWAKAGLEFMRVPYVRRVERAERGLEAGSYLGDLRYDRSPSADFSDFRLPEDPKSACPRFVPGWDEPRADLFRR
jgi:inner membrane protein